MASGDRTVDVSTRAAASIRPPVRRRPAPAAVCLIAAAALAFVARLRGGRIHAVDVHGVQRLERLTRAHPELVHAARLISAVGQPRVWQATVVLLLLGLSVRRQWRSALALALTLVLMTLAGPSIKNLIDRPRPVFGHPLAIEAGYSFPSDHALAAAAGATALAVYLPTALSARAREIASLAALFAVAVGMSRVALGTHFPSDVLGGWLVGTGLVCLVTVIVFPPDAGSRPPHD